MPRYVADRARELLGRAGASLSGARVLLLGVSYKPDIADLRETPALPLARILRDAGACVSFCDSRVPFWSVDGEEIARADDLPGALSNASLVILLQAHSDYDLNLIERRAALLLDTRGVTTAGEWL